MPWTFEQKLEALLRLPWTIAIEPSEFGDYRVARVAELPDAIATGKSDRELGSAIYASLKASLASRLEFDDDVALPKGATLPWAGNAQPPAPRRAAVVAGQGEAWKARNTGNFARLDAGFAHA